jgi:hypothetical protein
MFNTCRSHVKHLVHYPTPFPFQQAALVPILALQVAVKRATVREQAMTSELAVTVTLNAEREEIAATT